MLIRRFGKPERVFHLFLMLSFLIQAATGFSRLYYPTTWGKQLTRYLGGYEMSLAIHQTVGILMMVGFVLHTLWLCSRINWKNLKASLLGPDSLIPNLQDARHLLQRIPWLFGLGSAPKLDRWAYWEKFDYWAVYWGLPLLAVTGVMLMDPLTTSRLLPGWTLNVAVLFHRAEALLAVSYIFLVHFFIGHFRPFSFPMNEAMFSGAVALEEAIEEKPAWVERLRKEGKLELATPEPPARWYRVIYFIFGYMALSCGLYLLIGGIVYSRYIRLH